MHHKKRPPQWRRITISTNGKVFAVRWSDNTVIEMTDMFYAALEKIPHAAIALQLALDKYQKNNNHGS